MNKKLYKVLSIAMLVFIISPYFGQVVYASSITAPTPVLNKIYTNYNAGNYLNLCVKSSGSAYVQYNAYLYNCTTKKYTQLSTGGFTKARFKPSKYVYFKYKLAEAGTYKLTVISKRAGCKTTYSKAVSKTFYVKPPVKAAQAESGIVNEHLKSNDNYNPVGEYLWFDNVSIKAETPDIYKFDENGVPLLKVDGKYVRNNVVVAQYGLQEYSYFLKDNNKERYEIAKKMADWLVNNQNKDNGNWYYNYDYEVGGTGITLKGPFASSMAQGQAISLLVRIYSIEKDSKYLDAAELGLKPLKIPVADGGLQENFMGHIAFAEFPTIPSSYILNGFMFTVIGLYDLSYINPSSEAKALFDESIQSVIFMLPYYDNPKDRQSYYSLAFKTIPGIKPTVNPFYHNVHIEELKALNSVYPDETLLKYYNLWKSYLR